MPCIPEEKRRKSNIYPDLFFLFLCSGSRIITLLERVHCSKHDGEEDQENCKEELDVPTRPPAAAAARCRLPVRSPRASSSSSSSLPARQSPAMRELKLVVARLPVMPELKHVIVPSPAMRELQLVVARSPAVPELAHLIAQATAPCSPLELAAS